MFCDPAIDHASGGAGAPAQVVRGQKRPHLGEKALPRGLGLQEDVIASLERQEACAWNLRRYDAPFLERNRAVVAAVSDEGRRAHHGQESAHIDLAHGLVQVEGLESSCPPACHTASAMAKLTTRLVAMPRRITPERSTPLTAVPSRRDLVFGP